MYIRSVGIEITFFDNIVKVRIKSKVYIIFQLCMGFILPIEIFSFNQNKHLHIFLPL